MAGGSRQLAKIRSLLTKRSSSDIHIFELAFEHIEYILNIVFRHVFHVHFDSPVSVLLPVVDSLCFRVTSLNKTA